MATPEPPKQSINASLKKAFIEPFRFQRPRLTSVVSTASSTTLNTEEHVEGLPTLQYGSLDPNTKSIRLLEIIPGHGYEPLSAKLSICNLDDKPSYIALSYMWDKGSQRKHIECRGTKISVGQNLWHFLRQYREKISMQQYREKDPISPARLWIDAVCISQSNLAERSHQVTLMRDIYMGAASVIVWLGLPQGDEELAFMLTRYPSLIKADEVSTALIDLLNKTYWSRVWVVQEFVLAQSIDIWCGEFRADAAAFEIVWRDKDLLTDSPSLLHKVVHSHGGVLFKHRRDFRHTRHYKREILGRRNSNTLKATSRLRDLLQLFASSQSTEAYDKIYGFLGLASNGRGERITPDYSKKSIGLLVDVLRNQCQKNTKRGNDDDYNFLAFLRRTLNISRMELARYILHNCPDAQSHIYVLAASEFMVASVSFVSTISEVGSFMDHAEAFQESTWKPKWLMSSMHPKQLSVLDIQDLGAVVVRPETPLVLSYADPHVPNALNLARRAEILKSTELVIQSLIQSADEEKVEDSARYNEIGKKALRKTFSSSMAHGAELYRDARPMLSRRDTNHRYERYATFVGTNGIIGLACIDGDPGACGIAAGDRICVFSGITESNNAFIVRLDNSGKWVIVGFAIFPLPEQSTSSVQRTTAEPATSDTEKTMCFHCHLSDLLELQRCRILDDTQMKRMLEKTLRDEPGDEVHRCSPGAGQHEVLEFGL